MTLEDITNAAQIRIIQLAGERDDLCKHVDCDLLSDCSEVLANSADETMPYCSWHLGEAIADTVVELDRDAWANES